MTHACFPSTRWADDDVYLARAQTIAMAKRMVQDMARAFAAMLLDRLGVFQVNDATLPLSRCIPLFLCSLRS